MGKSGIVIKITLLVILLVALLAALLIFMNNGFKFNTKATLIYDKDIEEDFNKIDVYTKSLDVKFVKSSDNKVNVKVYDNKDNDVEVSVEGETLKIVSDNKNTCFFCFFKKREAIISLPEKVYDLVVETKSGDITSEINFENVKISATSGDVEIKNAKEANVKVTSGDIDIDEVNELTIECTSGDVNIDKINDYLSIETKSGDVKVKDLTITKDSNIKVTSGDVTLYSSSDNIYYNTKVSSGDVRINNNNRHADNELSITTKSGDIRVKN